MSSQEKSNFFSNVKGFPPIIDGRINIEEFLEASSGLVSIVERLGKVYAPVKYDMQGNIDKIKKCYEIERKSCLLELMHTETSKGQTVANEGLLWLNRALLLFEILFQQIISCLQTKHYDASMKDLLTFAYEGSIKRYHSWLISRMSPSLPQILKSLEVDQDLVAFESQLTTLNVKLHIIRCKIDDYFKDNNLFGENP
ncbi:Glycolipid transfer protein [Eumeta japonica]|uniref:Glycolipid transfer protein n=1 Tax=Eumeta variegata TaxID=151549 RepID=A0A4C1Y9C2_EUMVA|nr:Glycolipid transfer protein [Eumeta japonica]